MRVGHPHDEREGEHEEADEVAACRAVLDEALEGDADEAGRDRADEQQPGEPLVGRLDATLAQAADPGAQDAHDLAPEVGEHGDERAQVQGDVEGLVEVGVVEEEVSSRTARARGSDGRSWRSAGTR